MSLFQEILTLAVKHQISAEIRLSQTYVSLLITLMSLFQEILTLAVKHQISAEIRLSQTYVSLLITLMSLFQEILTAAVKHQISAEIRYLTDLCQSLDNLDVSISGDFDGCCKTPD